MIEKDNTDVLILCETHCILTEFIASKRIINAGEVGIKAVLSTRSQNRLIYHKSFGHRIVVMRFHSKLFRITIVGVYWPAQTSSRPQQEHDDFAASLNSVLNEVSQRDLLILLGDFNATGYNWTLLSNLMDSFDLCIPQQKKFGHLKKVGTWCPPGQPLATGNCIDLLIMRRYQINMVERMQIKEPFLVTTDHKMVTARFGLHVNRKYLGKKAFKSSGSPLITAIEKPKHLTLFERQMDSEMGKLNIDSENQDLDMLWRKFKATLTQNYNRGDTQEVELRGDKPNGKPNRKEKNAYRANIKKAIDDIRSTSVYDHRTIWHILHTKLGVKGTKADIPANLQAADFAKYMEELYSLDHRSSETEKPVTPEGTKNNTAAFTDPRNDPLPLPKPPDINEVYKAVSKLKRGRSPGVDGITGDIIKQSVVLQEWIHVLCVKCFDRERQPTEWLRSKVTLIKKSGKPVDKASSYRTVMVQVTAAKVYSIVVLGRIGDHLTDRIHPSQCGFRKSRSAIEAIHATQLLRDGCLAHGRSLCLLMADWEKAFDKLNREFMMNCLQAAGLHPKYLRIVAQSYTDAVALITVRKETCEVKLESGVKQGDILSPIIFINSLDTVLRRSIISAKHGFRLTREDYYSRRQTRFAVRSALLQEPIGCLCFADDITVPTETIEESVMILNALQQEALPANLKLGIGKPTCKTRRLLINCETDTSLDQVGVTTEYRQLGVLITNGTGYAKSIRDRIRIAGGNLHKLRVIWKSHDIGIAGKMVIMRAVVFASLFYGSETMALNANEEQLYKTFYHICLRRVLCVAPMTRLSSKELYAKTRSPGCINELSARRLRWYGHLLRMPDDNITKRILDWNPRVHCVDSRRPGRPRQSWLEIVKRDMRNAGLNTSDAKNRALWERRIRLTFNMPMKYVTV